MYRKSHCARRSRAVVAVQVMVLLPVLIGFAVVTVDVGVMYNARTDLQRTADAAALAAIAEVAYADGDVDPLPAATDKAGEYVGRNLVLEQVLSIDPGTDVIFGRAYYDVVSKVYNFSPGDLPTNAVRVIVRHTEGSPNGPLPLYFAGIFGKAATDVSADSVAMFVETCHEDGDCYDVATTGHSILCHTIDGGGGDSDGGNGDSGNGGDSEGGDTGGQHTIIVDTNAVPLLLAQGDTLGACDFCPPGDSDDSDDSQGEFGPPDSSDSDDSDPGDSDGSVNGDSDDSDDSQGEFGPPDSDDSDDSGGGDSGDSDGSEDGDGDDSDDSQGEFGPPDSDDSDDSDAGVGKVTICHIPPGNPENAQTIRVASPAVPAHLEHGDVLGDCPEDGDNGNQSAECLASIKVFLIQ